jgi:HAD superfamily hydrolase (TIGR01459 family)
MKNIAILSHAEPLILGARVIISDVWGVIHNGLQAWPQSYEALAKAKASGRPVILVTNAPRPSPIIITQLDKLGVPRNSYDGIVSSGDLAVEIIRARTKNKIYHIGPERDLALYDGLDVELTALDSCNYVVCSGLFDDDNETPEDYRATLTHMLERKLDFICANPDKVVERGTKLIYCAGALADVYESLGGKTLMAGKPYPLIYEEALKKATRFTGQAYLPHEVLCIGDALRTDIKGANRLGATSLFTIDGIHGHEVMENGALNHTKLNALFAAAGCETTGAMHKLAW